PNILCREINWLIITRAPIPHRTNCRIRASDYTVAQQNYCTLLPLKTKTRCYLTMTKQLETLRSMTTVVADTGDLALMRKYQPTDATTNPTLFLNAVQQPAYRPILDRVIRDNGNASTIELADQLLVAFGREILDIIPGRVSTEVDARLSFDTQASIERARQLIQMYEAAGVDRERVLIKLASTWEGIQAARELE